MKKTTFAWMRCGATLDFLGKLEKEIVVTEGDFLQNHQGVDGTVKGRLPVIPAEAGIQQFQYVLDAGLRRLDDNLINELVISGFA